MAFSQADRGAIASFSVLCFSQRSSMLFLPPIWSISRKSGDSPCIYDNLHTFNLWGK